ncbi:tyrosine-type recombinase/integrase (plasmid) [Burkholderia vietnamiensis]
MKTDNVRVMHISPSALGTWDAISQLVGLTPAAGMNPRYQTLPSVAVIVNSDNGLPLWAPTLFLARSATRSRGVTGDTCRTYAECLIDWIRFITTAGSTLERVNEELLQRYRTELRHERVGARYKTSSSTANLRVTVASKFHLWCQSHGFPSPLGAFLLEREKDERKRPLMPGVLHRHPRLLSTDEIKGLFQFARMPYKLAFRWGLTTGMRRFEVAMLPRSLLPTPEQLEQLDGEFASVVIRRKGGRELTIYPPKSLVEETNWYITTDRISPFEKFDDYVFINRSRFPVSRQALTKEFRRCADLIGSAATLHHLRHTFAVHVLRYLDSARKGEIGVAKNSLKVLQVLLGHAHVETTEIYLRAAEVTGRDAMAALESLYRTSHETDA